MVNRMTKVDNVNTITTTYTYDGAGQLITESKTGSVNMTDTYSYDASGNRVQKMEEHEGEEENYTVNSFNELNQITFSATYYSDGRTTKNYYYDVFGNLTNDGEYSYTYDAYFNRLATSKDLATNQVTTYDYYIDGLRKSKGNTYYIWLDGNMVYEFTSNDSNKYTYGHRLLYSDDAMYALNTHGDVVALFVETEFVNEWVNEFGDLCDYAYTVTEVTKRYEYDAFGNELNIDSTDTNPFRYCGEYFDAETGQIYLRARYYSPVIGRFTQIDPIRDGLNWYAYCSNNPIMFVDPSGFTEYFINGNAPTFVHDEGFKYNPNAKATNSDYFSLFVWKIISEAAEGLPHLKDAAKMYKNYLSNTGEEQIIDYERAYNEDSVYKSFIDAEIANMKNAAKWLYENGAGSTFNFTGELFGIPNGDSENWQKTLGAHYAYGIGQVTINEETGMVTIVATFYTEDMYNFNPGQADIASGTKDAVNGRFAELGWAKEFITKGSFTTTIECNLSDIPIGSSINAPGGR